MMYRTGSCAGRTRVFSTLTVAFLALLAIPSVAAADDDTAGTAPSAGYDDGFFLESDDENFRLELGGRVQVLYQTDLVEDGDDYDIEQMNFSIRRARLKLAGHAFDERLTFVLQPEFAGAATTLKDFYVDYEVVPDAVHARAGRWRFPFLREEITSSGSQMLVDRSTVSSAFGHGRDVGGAFHNGYKSSPPVEWLVGVFNGSTSAIPAVNFSDDSNMGDVFGPAVLARSAYNFGDMSGYSQADFDGGPLRFAVGGAVSTQPGVARSDQSELKGTLDYAVKAHGFSANGGVVAASLQDEDGGYTDREHFGTGLFSQAGYMVTDHIQPVVRYARTDLDDAGREAFDNSLQTRQEVLGGVSVYMREHALKWQTDAGAIIDEADDRTTTDLQVRSQLQLAF